MTIYKVVYNPIFSEAFAENIRTLVTESMFQQSGETMLYQVDSILDNKVLMNTATPNDQKLLYLIVSKQIQYVEL